MVGANVREFAAESYEVIDYNRPFSNFNLIDSRFDGISSLRRILSQIRLMGGRSIIVEDISASPDLAEENADIKTWSPEFDVSKSYAARLSFFKIDIGNRTDLADVANESFLGYVVFKRDNVPPNHGNPNLYKYGIKPRVYESVIKSNRHDNNFIRGASKWDCCVGNCTFSVEGYLYAQQNGVTNSCAHVALRTAIPRFTSENISYRQINEWISEYRASRYEPDQIPGEGLNSDEICHILEKAGANTFVGAYSKESNPLVPYQKYLYGSIESGYPAILFFGCGKQNNQDTHHCIPVFGHTFNEDTWVADANLIYFPYNNPTKSLSSGTWVSMFIGHDDNAGSNFCIPNHYIQSRRFCLDEKGEIIDCKQQQGGGVAYAIGTIPKEVEVNPIEAELIGIDYLVPILDQMYQSISGEQRGWSFRLKKYHERGLLVFRTILITEMAYAQHLKKVKSWQNKTVPSWLIDAIQECDQYVWMVELSVPELFSANRRKIGEILIRADKQVGLDRSCDNILFARLPGYCVFPDSEDTTSSESGLNGPQFQFYPIDVEDHVELFDCEENGDSVL